MMLIVTPVRRAAISDPKRTGTGRLRDREGAAGQREAGDRDQREYRAPGYVQGRKEIDVALHR